MVGTKVNKIKVEEAIGFKIGYAITRIVPKEFKETAF